MFKFFSLLGLFLSILFLPSWAKADCYGLFYRQTDSFTSDYRWAEDVPHWDETTGGFSVTSSGILNGPHTWNNYQYAVVRMTTGGWTSVTTGTASLLATVQFPGIAESDWSNTNLNAKYPTCGTPPNPCADKKDQDGAPMYTGLPYDAQTYNQTGICDNGCVAKPAAVSLDDYASDGSGYRIGPWVYTGDPCEAGVTSDLPPQPPQQDLDDAGDKACQSKCAGRAYQYNPETGDCECFGAPGTVDPPLDPTTPTPDPGSPPVPGAQTPTPNPGGDAQLGAQIENQGKQIGQGDAQLGQLGAINSKLGAVISNQAKQLGQGDKALDYQRKQLGTLEDIRNKLSEQSATPSNPGVPDNQTLDSSVGTSKNWTEHDDYQNVAQDRAQNDITNIPSTPQLPMNIDLQVSGSPVLSGVMFGRTIEIRFDMPWMETGYAIMKALLVGIGYLQVFLMINRTLTGSK